MPPMFSIITPTHDRAGGKLERCVTSIQAQTYRSYEHIIIDDGSTDDTKLVIGWLITEKWAQNQLSPIIYIQMEKHSQRVVARNTGMKAAKGEWICHLDSDDAYDPMYLATLKANIEREPEVNLWVCGSTYHGMLRNEEGQDIACKWTRHRDPWIPPLDTNGRHGLFDSGKVGTGMFVFHRECLKKIGFMPPWRNAQEIAEGIDGYLDLPKGATGYGTDKSVYPKGEVGNPFGEDHVFFQKLCLHYRAYSVGARLYIQYVRGG